VGTKIRNSREVNGIMKRQALHKRLMKKHLVAALEIDRKEIIEKRYVEKQAKTRIERGAAR